MKLPQMPTGLKVAGAVITNSATGIIERYEVPVLWGVIFVLASAIGSPMWLLAIVGVYAGWEWACALIEQYKEIKEMASQMSLMSGLFNKPPPATKEVELTVTETVKTPEPTKTEQKPKAEKAKVAAGAGTDS